MKLSASLPRWSIGVPLVAWLLLAASFLGIGDALGIVFMQGTVHLAIFAVYLFTTIVP